MFRSALPNEVDVLADLKITGWQTTYEDLIEPSVLEPFLDRLTQRSAFRRLIADPDAMVLVAEEDGVIVALGVADGRTGYIDSLHVHPGCRGRGVGRRLLGVLANALQQRGCTEVSLHVVSKNAGARRFYERLGGEFAGTAPAPWAPGDVEEACYRWPDPSQLIRATGD